MPGIVGIIQRKKNPQDAEAELGAMLRTLQHEPFYQCGSVSLPDWGCYLGWATVGSPPDLAASIISDNGNVLLALSGEDFEQPGDRSHSTLLSQYEAKGEAALRDLNGWFAGVLVDRRRNTILVFNDRFGMHRIYCHERDDSFVFASEAKALLSIRPETRSLDSTALAEFLTFGTVLGDRTLFSGIRRLPGGSAWHFDRAGECTRSRYFEPAEWESAPEGDDEHTYQELRSTLADVLPAYLNGAPRVAVSLTGGLDTRMVMTGCRPGTSDLPCYTYGGVYRDCFDVRVARRIADACGQPYRVLPLSEDFFRNFNEYAERTVWLTDGCLDLCGAHELYFSKLAREIAPVRMTGNYGSEIVRAISTFKPTPVHASVVDPGLRPRLAEAVTSFAEIKAGHPLSFAAFKEIPWHLHGRLAAARSQLVVRSPFLDNRIVRLLYRASDSFRRSNNVVLRLVRDLRPELTRIETDMGFDWENRSVRGSVRQLHRYLMFKAEWYYNAGMPGWLTRSKASRLLTGAEPLFLGWHKIEHYRLWFGKQLFDYVHEMLTEPSSIGRAYLDRTGYRQVVEAHESGIGNYMNEISRLITLELVQRRLTGNYPSIPR